jgi:uncharacterized lipoprotein YmbA
MKVTKSKYLIGLLGAFSMTAAACSVLSPTVDRSRYFVLEPAGDSDGAALNASASGGRTVNLGLGPITIPRYLDRPEVVTRLSATEFSISDTDRWGEPLDTSVSRVLAQDLSTDLPGLHVVFFPWSRKTPIDYRISVDFRRLEKTSDGKAVVQSVWNLYGGPDNNFIQRGVTSFSAPAGEDQRSASAALSQGIAQVGHEVAQVLQKQSQLLATTPERSAAMLR